MDWSLLDPEAEHRFLRQHLAYKQTWPYYAAMIADVLLRFNWVFYVAFPQELQHSAILSFLVGFSEVTRRGIWTIFRVENEHCTNVGRFRASRDIALPYSIKKDDDSSDEHIDEEDVERAKDCEAAAAAGDIPGRYSTRPGSEAAAGEASISQAGAAEDERVSGRGTSRGTDVERRWWSAADKLKQRRKKESDGEGTSAWQKGGQNIRSRLGNILRRAHAQDFERKRKGSEDEAQAEQDSDDDEEDRRSTGGESDEEDGIEDARSVDGHQRQHGNGNAEDEGERDGDGVETESDGIDRLAVADAERYLHRARGGQDI